MRRIRSFFGLFMAMFILQNCSSSEENIPENPLFTRMDASVTGVDFKNEVTQTDDFNIFNYRNFYNGGGVALGDINNNGLIDIYFTSNQGDNRLYLNLGNFEFKDITETAGVAGNGFWTTGVTMADVNGNGLLDIYVLNSGLTSDDNRRNELFINQGDLTFKEEAANFNLDDPGFSVHASFFDFDGDGDLDLYLVNNSFQGTADQMRVLPLRGRDVVSEYGGDKFFRNNGGTFVEITENAGIYKSEIGFGLGASVGDLTGNRRPDIYVSNDFWERDYLYINQGDGTFSEELVNRTDLISHSSMGSDIADINNNGFLDIFVTDMLPVDYKRIKTMTLFEDYSTHGEDFHNNYHYQYLQNTLQLNNGDGTFTETGFLSGVSATDWSWGALFFDFDNNGWRDLFVSNGIYRDITDFDFTEFLRDRDNLARIIEERGRFDIHEFIEMMPATPIRNFAFINNQNSTFSDSSFSLGFHEPAFSNGAAYADLNNNGTLDLVINNLNGEAFIYRNNAGELFDHNYLKIRFEGEGNNRFGVGAHVSIYAGGNNQVAENFPSRSFQSSVPPELHFGLGHYPAIDSLIVVWADHKKQTLRNIDANQTIYLAQEQADQFFTPVISEEKKAVFSDVTETVFHGNTRHRENNFNDYEQQLLLPRMLSRESPKVLPADVNGNGRADLFVTGGRNDSDKIFIQHDDGTFRPFSSADFISDNWFESTAAAFIDLNGNGYPDLIVGSGGNQDEDGSENLQIRVYLNDGTGIFSRAPELEPGLSLNVSSVAVNETGKDGFQHLFIGGRVVAGNYGVIPRSYLFEYHGNGNWVDITPEELQYPGMVTDAVWTDYNGDGKKGLIVVGEWMPVTFYSYSDGQLKYDYTMEKSSGWWTSIKETDLNGNGKPEFILGNWGVNTRLQTTPEKPVTMFVNDFNRDGNSNFVINTYPEGKVRLFPYHSYRDMAAVFPELDSQIQNHHEFAAKAYEDIFTASQRNGERKFEAHTFHTSLLYQKDGEYHLKKLPLEAQVSPVFGVIADDINENGNQDLLLLGNFFGHKSERLAGNHGVILINEGGEDFTFSFMPYRESNTIIPGEVRDAAVINSANGKYFLIARNNQELLIYRKN